MNRLLPIEGLRAYMALWVVIGHVMFFSIGNFRDPTMTGWGPLLGRILGDQSPKGVLVFMIISGFVIFFLLDKKTESYGQFLVRRFFRLYPVYVIVLLIAIAAGPFSWWSFQQSEQYMTADVIHYYSIIYWTTQKYWSWHVILHLAMLQGAAPSAILGATSAFTFIIAAWSIAVEWQYYLVAPLVYFLVVTPRPVCRFLLLVFAVWCFLFIGHSYQFSALLPIFIPYFFLGIVSYFLYKRLHSSPPDLAFPVALGLAFFIYSMGSKSEGLIPLVVWLPFYGLLCEPPDSISSKLFLGIFNNPVAQFLGSISYGIYLCHELIIMVMQYFLFTLVPDQDRVAHFWTLLMLTLPSTVLAATILHWAVEVPGMNLGKKLANRMKGKPMVSA